MYSSLRTHKTGKGVLTENMAKPVRVGLEGGRDDGMKGVE